MVLEKCRRRFVCEGSLYGRFVWELFGEREEREICMGESAGGLLLWELSGQLIVWVSGRQSLELSKLGWAGLAWGVGVGVCGLLLGGVGVRVGKEDGRTGVFLSCLVCLVCLGEGRGSVAWRAWAALNLIGLVSRLLSRSFPFWVPFLPVNQSLLDLSLGVCLPLFPPFLLPCTFFALVLSFLPSLLAALRRFLLWTGLVAYVFSCPWGTPPPDAYLPNMLRITSIFVLQHLD